MGRPSKYNKRLADRILSEYGAGRTLADITKAAGMPSRITVYAWRSKFPEFGAAYERAAAAHSEALVDLARSLVLTADSKGAKLADVQQRFLTWCASKIHRAAWGDKVDINVTKTIDISPALALAVERMAAVGTGSRLVEAVGGPVEDQ